MPAYLPHVLALPLILTLVIVVAATLLGLRHLRPAAVLAFLAALISGWRTAHTLDVAAAAQSNNPENTYAGLAVLPAAFSTAGIWIVTFALAAAVIWAIQTLRARRLKHTPTKRTLGDWTPNG